MNQKSKADDLYYVPYVFFMKNYRSYNGGSVTIFVVFQSEVSEIECTITFK